MWCRCAGVVQVGANWTVLERLSVSHNALVAADVAALLCPRAGAGEGERGRAGGGGKDLLAVPVGRCGAAALTSLDVGGNLLGDAGATTLAGLLGHLPRLAELGLRDNRLTDHCLPGLLLYNLIV